MKISFFYRYFRNGIFNKIKIQYNKGEVGLWKKKGISFLVKSGNSFC